MLDRRAFACAAAGLATAIAAPPARAQAPRRGRTAAELGIKLSDAQLADGVALLRRAPSVDVHSHAGRFFMRGPGAPPPFAATAGEPFPEAAIARMRLGGVSAVQFAAVADLRLLVPSPTGIAAAGDFSAGEALADYRRQLAILNALIAGGALLPGRDSRDIRRAHNLGRTACVVSVEGGDFIDDRLDRVADAYAAGVRSITVVHYKVNRIGDTQTSPAVHGGLSPFGRAVIQAMNRAGVMVDLSHASLETTRQAAEVSSRPMIISHSNLQAPGLDHPRLVSLEHARLVTARGGLVGALPAGAGETTFAGYIDTLLRMVDALGVDHVAIGTDMDFTFASVLSDYADWSLIPAGLLARGMHAPEVAQVIGGNFLRVLDAVQAHRR